MSKYQKIYFKRAMIVAYILQCAPFVKMVGLNGSVSRREAKKASDIDFLIIAKKGRLWSCRIFVTLITQLTGYRRYADNIAGRICLNRYQTDDFLEILPHNEYHARVFSQLIPLLDNDNIFLQYVLKNKWMKILGHPVKENQNNITKNILLIALRKTGEWILGGNFGDFVEKKLRSYQRQRILKDKRTHEAPKGRVRISDKELCFHPEKG